jgi:hypothetical protein
MPNEDSLAEWSNQGAGCSQNYPSVFQFHISKKERKKKACMLAAGGMQKQLARLRNPAHYVMPEPYTLL